MAYKTLDELKKKSPIVRAATESGEQKFKYFQNPDRYKSVKTKQNNTQQEYKNQATNPVRVTDYVAPAGLGSISYSDSGKVAVGGENIPVLYMDGDRAVVDKNNLDKAYENLKNRLGISTATELKNNWDKEYGKKLDNAYDELSGYGEWDYELSKDPAYRAYSEMYMREGERAYRDAAARLASKNNGNMTSAAQTLANQQLAYYMSMLSDKIPELQKNAYERYRDGYNMKKENYDAVREAAESAWNRNMQANEIAKSDYAVQQENERQRTLNAQADRIAQLEEEAAKAANRLAEAKNVAAENENVQTGFDNSWGNAEKRGYFTESEGALWNIPKKEDGTYMTPNEIKINNELQYFKEVLIPQLDYEAMLELNFMIQQMAQKNSNEASKAARDFSYDKQLAAYKASL